MYKENILVIDDSILICSIVERELKSETINVLKAYDGKTAMHILNNERLSLILLDITLPDTDGYNICKRLKADSANSDVPVIFITSRENEDSLVKAFEVGAIDYISKPFSSLELNVRVKAHLENKRIKDELKQTNEELQKALAENIRLAYRDKLTNLYNRHFFLENIDKIIKESKLDNKELWLFMFDIDDFKRVNDSYGHQHGDFVITNIATIINKHCSYSGIVCRWGGEEFVAVVHNIRQTEIEKKAQDICNEISSYNFNYKDIDINCSISIGISKYDFSLNIDENISLCDEAMYYRKRNGKNGYHIRSLDINI